MIEIARCLQNAIVNIWWSKIASKNDGVNKLKIFEKVQQNPILAFFALAIGLMTGLGTIWNYFVPSKYPLIEFSHNFGEREQVSLEKELKLARQLISFKYGDDKGKVFAFRFDLGDVRDFLKMENGEWFYEFGGRLIHFHLDGGCHLNTTVPAEFETDTCDDFLVIIDQPDPQHSESAEKFNEREFSLIRSSLGEPIKTQRIHYFDPKIQTSINIYSSKFGLEVIGFGKIQHMSGGPGVTREQVVPQLYNPDKFALTLGN